MNDPTAEIPPAGLVLLGPRFRAGRDVDHVGGGVGHVGVEHDLPLPVAAELQVCIPEVDGTGSGCVRERRSITVSGTEGSDLLWYESLSDDESWFSLWSGYIRCVCRGICSTEEQCPVCGEDPPNLDWEVVRNTDGNEYRVPPAFCGAEGRYEDWIYLRMLEREWLRPVEAKLYDSIPEDHRPSARAIVVLMFWSYFETRIERLFRETAKAVPEKVMDHLLDRYSSVGARMDRLYKIVFSTTYRADLNDLGYGKVAALLGMVQKCRNRFTHGHPEAIDDTLVEELVAGLKDEHEGWIAVFNRRLKEVRK